MSESSTSDPARQDGRSASMEASPQEQVPRGRPATPRSPHVGRTGAADLLDGAGSEEGTAAGGISEEQGELRIADRTTPNPQSAIDNPQLDRYGRQRGRRSLAALFVSRVCALPSAFIT